MKQTSTTKDADTQANTTTTTTTATSQRQQQQQQQSPPPPLPPLPSALTSVHAGGSGAAEVTQFQRSDWIRRLFPPKYKVQVVADSVQQLEPSNVEEIFHASEIVVAWLNSSTTTAATSSASSSSSSSSSPAASSSISSVLGRGLTLDDVFALSVYTFDFGSDGQNERSPQNVLNRALSLRTTVELLRIRAFLFNFLAALRKLPRFRMDPAGGPAAPSLFVPIAKDGFLGGFDLAAMVDSSHRPKVSPGTAGIAIVPSLSYGSGVDSYESFYSQCSATLSRNVSCDSGAAVTTAKEEEENDGGGGDDDDAVLEREERRLVGTVFVCPSFITAYTTRVAARNRLSAQEAAQSRESFSYHNPNVECVVAGTLVEVVCGSALWHYDVQPFAVFPAEGSVLLEADRVFRVLAITHSRGLRTIRVAAVDTPVLLQDILPPRGEIIIRNSQKAPPPPPPPLPPQRYEGGPIPNFVSSAIYWATKNTEFHYFDPQTMLYVVYPDVDASKSDIIFSASTAATVVPAPPGSSYKDEDEEEEGGNGYYDGGYGGKDENSEYSDEDDENEEEEEEEEEVWADDFVYSSGEGSSKGVHKSPVNYYNRNSGRGGRRGVISKVAEGASSLISAVSNYKGSGVIESDSDNSDGLSGDEDGEEHASDDDDDNNDNNDEGNGSSSSSSNSNSNYYNNNEEEEEEENSEDEEDEEEDGCIVEVMPENSPKKRLEKLVFALNAQDLTPAQAAARCQELEEFTAANWQEPYFNELFLRLRGVESLLNIVRFLPPEQETFGAICGTLARVRCKSDDAFVEGNTVYLLLEAFELFFGDRTICAHYLQMVCANFGERAVEAAAGIGSVLVYLRAQDCHYDAPEVCEAAFRLLVLFAKHSSDTVAVIARAMRVESLFCFVKKYAESVPIVNQIFGVFALLTNTIPDYDRLLVDHGIIPLLTAYIRRQHKYEHDATCYFCAMATRLTPNESYRQRLISEGCGRAVRQLITDNITNVNLCVSCCSLLEVLTRKTSKKGAQQQQQQQSPQLTSQGTGGGHGHGNSNGNGMITGYSSGSSAGTSFLTQLLGANKNDPVTARSICLSLKFFLEFDKDKCLAFTQNGGMSMLMKILRRSNNSSPEAGVGTDLQATACALLYSVFNTCSEDPTALTAELRKFLAEFPAAVSPYMASIEFALKACSIYYVIAAKYVPQCAMPDGKTIELLLRAVHGHMKSIMVCQYALSTIEKFHEYAPRLVERPEYLDLFLEVLRTYTRRSDAICAKAIVLVAYVARASDANAVLHKSLTDTLTAVNAHVGSDAVKGAFCILLDALLERDPSIKSSLVKTGLENIIRNLNLPASTMARCKTLIREGLMSAPPVPAIRKDLISTAATSSSSSSSNSHRERTLYAIEGGDSYGGKRAHGMKRKRGRGSLGGKRARKSAQKRSDNSGNGGSNSNDVYSDEDSLEEDDDSCYYNDGRRDGRRTVNAASAPANGADSFRDEDEDEDKDEDEDYDYYYDERDEDDGDGSESDEDEGSRGACAADCGYCGGEEVSKDVLEELIKQFASTDAAEVKRATGVVKQLVQRSDVLKVLSIGLGVTQAGFAAIEQHPADTGVCDNVIYIFQILSKARDSCAIFLENGGLESLARLAEHNDVSFRTCAHACAVLCSYVGSGLLASLHIDPVRYLAVVARAVGRLADTDSRGFICEHLCAAACSGLASTPPADIAAFIEPHLPMLLNIVCAKTASQRSCRAVFELFHLYANSVVKGALDTLAVRRNAARFVEAAERTLDFYYTTPEVCEPVARLICALADIDPTACTARRRNLCTKLAHTVEANTENRNIVLFGISAIFHVCNFYNDYRPAQAQEQSSKSGQKEKPSSTPASGEAEPESKTKTKVEGATADAEEAQNHSNSSSSAVAEDKKCSEDEEYEEGEDEVNDDEEEEEEEEEEDDDDDVCYIFSQCYQLFMKVFQQIFDIPQMCRLFLKYLDFLTNSDHMAQLLLQNGDGVQTIVLGLARCSSNLSLCVKLAVALCGVAKRKPNGAELVLANGGLGAMMALVRTHPASKDVAQLFCYVLCLFTAKVVNATYVGSFSECADILIDTFRRFKDDSTVCDLFCSAAKKLIPVGQSVAKFANSTFLALLLGVMKAPATSQKLCESLAGLLCMIEYPTQDREFLAAFVAGLFDVMAAHSSSEVLLNECTLILSSLAEHDSDCCCSLIATEERIRALLGVFAAVQKTDTRESICLIIASIIEKAPPNWGSPSPSSNSSLSPSPQQQQTQTQQQQQQPTKKDEEDTKKKRKKKGRKEESNNNNNNSCGNAAPATAAAAAVTTTSHQGTLSVQPQQLSLLQPSNVNGSRAVAKFIGENGGVALILGFMEAHLESAFMCDKPVRALQALARYPPNAVQIIDSGVERILAKCVQGIDSERKVQLQKFYRVVVSAKESLRMSSEVSSSSSSSSSGAATLKT